MPSLLYGLRACCGDTGQDWALCLFLAGRPSCPPTPQRLAPSGWVALSPTTTSLGPPLGRVQGNPSSSPHLQPAMEVLCFTVSLNIKMVVKGSEAQCPWASQRRAPTASA